MENPTLMQNMMNAPYVQSMLQQLGSNPELAEQMIVNNPMFAGNEIVFLPVQLELGCGLQNGRWLIGRDVGPYCQ